MIDPSSEDMVDGVNKLTKGQGAEVAFDAAGVQAAVYSAIKAIRSQGTLVNIALWGDKEVSLNMIDMLFGERKYMASRCFPFAYPWSLLTIPSSHHVPQEGLSRSHRSDHFWTNEAQRHDHQSSEDGGR